MTSAKQFRQQIARSFDMQELRDLVMDLDVDWDELVGYRKSAKINSLLAYLQRQGRLDDLIATLRQDRPHFDWPDNLDLLTATPADPQGRNRQNILNNIHYTWIEGVLEPALHNDVALSLGLSYQHDALNRPRRSLYPEEQHIPPETSLGEIFAARGRSLLILGEPASGKTIALLQLLQELLAAAQADPAEPIPIVLNLSSWAREQGVLTDWIVEELLVQYQAPRQLSRDWLAANQLTLLLDGLDEVAATHRDACVEAINAFKADHAADMVVCSRLADYEQLQTRLNLSAAIRLQPLTARQIDDYLASFGTPLADLRQAVAADDEWRELAQSPLMLNLMAFTYSQAPLPEGATLTDKRYQLFTAYARRNLHYRPLPSHCSYTDKEAFIWLHNIASRLQAHDQSVFQIESLQPSWLFNSSPFRWLTGLLGGMIAALGSTLAFILLIALFNASFDGLIFSLIGGLVFGLLNGVRFGLSNSIALFEEVRWQFPPYILLWQEVKKWLLSGLFFGVLFGMLSMNLLGALVGMVFGVLGVFIVGVEIFFRTGKTSQLTQPNQGIRVSLQNAQRTGLIYGLLFGLVAGLLSGLLVGLIFGRVFIGLFTGLFMALLGWLFGGLFFGLVNYGGLTVVQHYVLRWLLARQGVLPFPFRDRDLIAYLDAMAARLLLRRVGGGWIFIHRTLLEFFADETEFQKLINDL